MRKSIFLTSLLICFVSFYYTSAVNFAEYNSVYVNALKNAKLNQQAQQQIDYELIRFPVPKLLIKEIKEDGKLELKNIKIGFSFLSILTFAPKVKDLNIEQVRYYLNSSDVNLLNHDQFIKELITSENYEVEANIGRLEFIETDQDVPLVLEDFYFDGVGSNTVFSGVIESIGKIKGVIKYTENKANFEFGLVGDGVNVTVNENYENTELKDGKVVLKTTNLASKIAKIIPDFSQALSYLASSEEINVNFDINVDENRGYYKNIKINSVSIDGGGDFVYSRKGHNDNKINLNFSKLDINGLQKSKLDNNSLQPIIVSSAKGYKFDENKLDANIYIDKLQLNEVNALNKVNVNAVIDNNKFVIKEFNGQINQTGSFKIVGFATQNNFRTLFEGNIAIAHNDLNDLAEFVTDKTYRTEQPIPFNFSSDLRFSAVELSLHNIFLKTANNMVSGQISTKFIGSTPRIASTIKIEDLDTDGKNIPILPYIFDYLKSLTQNTREESYLGKFIPIRKINALCDAAIEIKKLKFNNKEYKNIDFDINLSPGRVKVNNLKIVLDQDFLDLNADLQAQGIKPIANLKINDGQLGVSFLSPSAIIALRDTVVKDFSTDKIDLNIQGYLSKIYQGEISLDRVNLEVKIKDKLVEITKLETDLLKGRLHGSGSILFDPLTLNFVYALNSASIPEIKKLIPNGYINTDGVISAGGMWATNGKNLDELLFNFYTKSNIIAKGLSIENLSLDDLMQNVNDTKYDLKNLENDIKQSLLTGKTEVQELTSDIEISKGIISLPNMQFKTKFASSSASAVIGIYDFTINLQSIFLYSIATNPGQMYVNYAPAKINLTAVGNIFTPKKEADISAVATVLKTRQSMSAR